MKLALHRETRQTVLSTTVSETGVTQRDKTDCPLNRFYCSETGVNQRDKTDRLSFQPLSVTLALIRDTRQTDLSIQLRAGA